MTKTFTLTAIAALLAAGGALPGAAADELEQVDQAALNAMIAGEGREAAFAFAFEAGDELTEASFTAAQGVGAMIGERRRFTRLPRADLAGDTEWAAHLPRREGGPNATSCIACHNAPGPNGAGDVALNAVVDPGHTGDPRLFLERNTLHLFALGVPQRLAEEMSMALYAQRDAIRERACVAGAASGPLTAKGVSFGTVTAQRMGVEPCEVAYDWSALEGIDEDLVVRPFGWKGTHATIRDFTRGAAHNELGMQAVELIGDIDGDHDGVTGELTVGDMTALTIYMAALERPVSKLELAALGLATVPEPQAALIRAGEALFSDTGCASCHTPTMILDDPVFHEPSQVPGFHDAAFPSGADPADLGLMHEAAIWFDMTKDQPNNRIEGEDGSLTLLGALPATAQGGAVTAWYTDFKRHDMGEELADPADHPMGIGARMWPTRSLAGVGSTGPWLHDGRATTLEEAILAHGGEGQASRDAFAALDEAGQAAIVAFLDNLVIEAGIGAEE